MTIATISNSVTCLGNNVTNPFSFNFIYDSAANIQVTYTDINGISTVLFPSQYTLFLNPPATNSIWGIGGTVLFPTSGSPIATGTSLTISRIVPLTQTTAIANQGDFSPEVIESALDTLCLEIQQVSGRTGQLRGTWATGISYNYADIVQDGVNGTNTQNFYMCAISNTSGTWSTDLAAGDWILAINVQAIINSSTGNMSTTVYDPAAIRQQLVGLTATQTLNNKSVVDSTFFIIDDVDPTKKIQLQASNISTGTTRLLTVQDVSGVLYIAGGQDVTIADGGTNSSTALGARTNILPTQSGKTNLSLVTNGTDVDFTGNTVLQRVSVITGTVATGTTVIPPDNTIPQNTEGDQYMTLAITPKSATSVLVIEVIGIFCPSATQTMGMALFQDSTASAISTTLSGETGNSPIPMPIKYIMTSGTISATTFKVRAGMGGAGTTTFNGQTGNQYFGGTLASSIIITEYAK